MKKNNKFFLVILFLAISISVYFFIKLSYIRNIGNLGFLGLFFGVILASLNIFLEKAYYLGNKEPPASPLPIAILFLFLLLGKVVDVFYEDFVSLVVSVYLTTLGVFFFRKKLRNSTELSNKKRS